MKFAVQLSCILLKIVSGRDTEIFGAVFGLEQKWNFHVDIFNVIE